MKKRFIPLAISAAALSLGIVDPAGLQLQASQPVDCRSELRNAMAGMHNAVEKTRPAGDCDEEFVRLMLPHHQAAIDMARSQLLHGKDPALRRLAQEIITDQQSEIELMQRWLKQRPTAPAKRTGEEQP